MRTFRKDYFWLGREVPPTGSSNDGTPWRAKITGAAPPTVVAAGGGMRFTLTADNQVQVACLYWGDVLGLDIDDIAAIEFEAKIDAAAATGVTLSFGLATAQSDTISSLSAYALFQVPAGGLAVTLNSKDGTNPTQSAIATGLSMPTTRFNQYRIDFTEGVRPNTGFSAVGGKRDIRFFADNGQGNLRPVGRSTAFDMGAYTAGLQPFVQLQKAANTNVNVVDIRRITVEFRNA